MLKEKQFDGKQPQGYKKKSFIPFNGNFNITSSQSVEETAKQNLFYTKTTQIRMMMIFGAMEKSWKNVD